VADDLVEVIEYTPNSEETPMGSFGILQFLGLIIFVFLWSKPAGMILRRLGFNGWWGLVAVTPVLNLVGIWWLAYTDWPEHKKISN
jgi:hypothetical protein